MRSARILWPAWILLALSFGTQCSWRDDLDGTRRKPEGLEEPATPLRDGQVQEATIPPQPPPRPEVDPSRQVAIDLFASRPLVDAYRKNSLVIDASTPAFIKYIDGGVRRDWKRGVTLEGSDGKPHSAAILKGLAAEVYFPFDTSKGGISADNESIPIRFTAKSAVAKQLVSIFLNEHKITDLSMPTKDWNTYSLSAPTSHFVVGENKLRFYFRSAGEFAGQRSAAAFSKFVIGASLSDDNAFEAGVFNGEREKRVGLRTNAASRLSYSVKVPNALATLRIAIAGEAAYSIRVQGERASQSEEREKGTATKAWQQIEVDLGRYKDKIVRIDLLSEGPVTWSEGQITISREERRQSIEKAPDRIIYWSVSSLRSDRLLDSVGRGFKQFVDAGFSISQLQASSPSAGGSHASSMLGRFRIRGSIAKEQKTLAESLQSAGYTTALISGNGFVNDSAGFSQGFDVYDNPMRRQHHFGAKTLWRQAKRFLLQHRKQRAFVHIATVEAHVPYRPSEDALRRQWVGAALFTAAKTLTLGVQIAQGRRVATAREKEFIRALYDASISDANSAFTAMLEELEELNLEGTTAIILAGDHGEQLWERGNYGHGDNLYQESLSTPFAIQSPTIKGFKAPKRGSSIDIFPTILDLAKIESRPDFQGLSLFDPPSRIDERPIFSGLADGSRAIRFGKYKLIYKAGGGIELYDMDADANEQNNIAQSHPVVARTLRITLATLVAYETAWSTSRWGQPSAPKEAFASDQGF